MKKLVVILFAFGLASGASAQFHGGGHIAVAPRIVAPRVIIGGGYAPFSPYLGYGYGFGYNPYFGSPYGSSYRSSRPTKLDLQVEDIKNDYKERIWSAKHDSSLARKDRKAKVHELKHERDAAVIDAKRNYYKTRSDYRS